MLQLFISILLRITPLLVTLLGLRIGIHFFIGCLSGIDVSDSKTSDNSIHSDSSYGFDLSNSDFEK